MALLDYLFFGQTLQYYHVIGTIAIVVCTVVISLSGVVFPSVSIESIVKEPALATWVPALFGVFTPVFFSLNGVLTKHITSEKIGFDATNITFTAYLLVNIFLLIFAIPYWTIVNFDKKLFWIGLFGSVINVLGLVCIQNALAKGPAGPVSAIAAVSTLLVVIIEAIINHKMLNFMELIGVILGFFGAMILVIPEQFEKLGRKLCCIKDKDKVYEQTQQPGPSDY